MTFKNEAVSGIITEACVSNELNFTLLTCSANTSHLHIHHLIHACNKRKRQPIGMFGRRSGNHDWLLANASACVSCGFRLCNARNASDLITSRTHVARSLFGETSSTYHHLVESVCICQKICCWQPLWDDVTRKQDELIKAALFQFIADTHVKL